MLERFNRRLADDATQAWKWGSIRFMALGGACEAAVKFTPDKVAQYAPAWLMSGLSTVAIVCLVLAGVSRVTVSTKEDPHERPTDTDAAKPDNH